MHSAIETVLAVVSFAVFMSHLVGPNRLDRLWQRSLLALVNFLGRLAVRWLMLLHKIRQELL